MSESIEERVLQVLMEHRAQHKDSMSMAFAFACGRTGVIGDATEPGAWADHLRGLLAEVRLRQESAPAQRCATCRWWDHKEEIWPGGQRSRESMHGFRACQRTMLLPDGLDDSRAVGTLAMAFDHEDYQAELWTSPEFGCRLWEAKLQIPE